MVVCIAEEVEGAVDARALAGIGLVAKSIVHIFSNVTRKLFLSVNTKIPHSWQMIYNEVCGN